MVTMNRLFLVSHAATVAVREARFPDDESLDRAPSPSAALSRVDQVRCGPERRCAETAAGLGFTPVVDPALSDLDCGAWRGRSLSELDEDELLAWLTDPDAVPHGGESVRRLLDRVGGWLDELPAVGRLVAVTSPAVVRAAVVHAISATPASFWRIDVSPLTLTHLFGVPGRWTLRETGHALS